MFASDKVKQYLFGLTKRAQIKEIVLTRFSALTSSKAFQKSTPILQRTMQRTLLQVRSAGFFTMNNKRATHKLIGVAQREVQIKLITPKTAVEF